MPSPPRAAAPDFAASIHELYPKNFDLAVHMHARYDATTSKRVSKSKRVAKEVEPFKLMWLEEPVPAENIDAMRDLRASTSRPICCGENVCLRWGLRELLEKARSIPSSRSLEVRRPARTAQDCRYGAHVLCAGRVARRHFAHRHDCDRICRRRHSEFSRAGMALDRFAGPLAQLRELAGETGAGIGKMPPTARGRDWQPPAPDHHAME